MKGTHLGEFEEIVLLAVAGLGEEAYGLAIKTELVEQAKRNVSLSAIHAACNRLQDKGFLEASFGQPSEKRGGKRKKIYRVSLAGERALREARELRERMWQRIAPGSFQLDWSW